MGGEGESVRKEFVPRQVRTCNAVAWNPHSKNLLATGLDKVRSDFSCLIWDVRESGSAPSGADDNSSTASSTSTRDNSFNLSSIATTEKVERPIGQFANSEAVMSVTWLPGSPGCLATGTGARWLRIYDMRDALKPVNSVVAHASKAIYGVCVDPHREHCLATFSEESIVKLWDTRVLKEPVMQLTSPGTANNKIVQISWCPTRGAGLLGVSAKDENHVRVWNVNSGMLIQDEEIARQYPSLATPSSISPSSRSGSLPAPSASRLGTGPSSSNSAVAITTTNNAGLAVTTNAPLAARPTSPGLKDARSSLFATSDVYDIGSEQVSSFSWHPSKGQLLTVSTNAVIDILNLHEPIPLSFSSQSRLCFGVQKMMIEGPVLMKPTGNPALAPAAPSMAMSLSSGANSSHSATTSSYHSQNALSMGADMHTTAPGGSQIDPVAERDEALRGRRDISLVMYERAVAGYGGDAKINRQVVALFDNPELEYVWNWINDMKFNLTKKASEFKGIYAVMTQSKNQQPSKPEETMTFADNAAPTSAISTLRKRFPVFNSTERQFCLKMCGWGFATSAELAAAADTSSTGRISRTVALAVFHLDITQAMQILRSNASILNNDLKLVSLALAGFADSTSNHWKSAIDPLRSQISDPYLSAVLAFLCAANPDYWDVLYETDISLRDKLAFALRFYDDDKLTAFLERTKVQVIGQGRLTGLLLTGIDAIGGGVDLLQNYVDRTSDLQTATLILSHISFRKIKDPRNRINIWTHMYRLMLDKWSLWTERAKFDVQRGEANPPPHVMARCNFCNASLTLGRETVQPKTPMAMGRGMGAGLQSASASAARVWQDKKKISSCPSCRKPLPRCALCLLPMNCIPPSPDNRHLSEGLTWSSGVQNFDDWFSWCQSCKHGGHSGHLADWFKTHAVCPVSDCDCKCTYV